MANEAELRRLRELLAEAQSILAAVAPDDPVDPVPQSRQTDAGRVGYRWFSQVIGGPPPDFRSWQAEYSFIGMRSPDERKAVRDNLAANEWIKSNRHMLTPKHVVKFWDRYLLPEQKPEPTLAETVLPLKQQAELNAAQLLAQRLRLFDQETDAVLLNSHVGMGGKEAREKWIAFRAEQRVRIERKG